MEAAEDDSILVGDEVDDGTASTHRRLQKTSALPPGPTCSICLIQPLVRPAVLDSCNHTFCLVCIYRWSQQSNNCPCCRSVFAYVTDAADPSCCVEVAPRRREETADASSNGHLAWEDENDEEEDDWGCEFCQSAEREDQLLICDGCERMWHTWCLEPPLLRIPDGNWFCGTCDNIRRQHHRAAAELAMAELYQDVEEVEPGAHEPTRQQTQRASSSMAPGAPTRSTSTSGPSSQRARFRIPRKRAREEGVTHPNPSSNGGSSRSVDEREMAAATAWLSAGRAPSGRDSAIPPRHHRTSDVPAQGGGLHRGRGRHSDGSRAPPRRPPPSRPPPRSMAPSEHAMRFQQQSSQPSIQPPPPPPPPPTSHLPPSQSPSQPPLHRELQPPTQPPTQPPMQPPSEPAQESRPRPTSPLHDFLSNELDDIVGAARGVSGVGSVTPVVLSASAATRIIDSAAAKLLQHYTTSSAFFGGRHSVQPTAERRARVRALLAKYVDKAERGRQAHG